MHGDPGVNLRPNNGDPDARFWSFVTTVGDCWLWTGGIHKNGYASFRVAGVRTMAHRWAYEHFVGPIPDGLQIDHLCRVRHCVNPSHMEPVTPRENTNRSPLARVHRTHCPEGHPYDEANTYYEAASGCRRCRICRSRQRKARGN